MKFKTLTLENFRQFVGIQTINFSIDSQKNTTLILGKNGNGKTGIFRAIMFALYGDYSLSQDQSKDKNELVNWKILKENPGRAIIAKVTLNFEHLGINYSLTRCAAAKYESGEYTVVPILRDSSISPIALEYTSSLGETKKVEEENEIQRIIEEILPKSMSEFFFFDGEQRSSLLDDTKVKNKKEQRNRIQKEIYKILQLEPLEEARKILKSLQTEYRKTVKNISSNEKVQELTQSIEDLEFKIHNHEDELKLIKQNIFYAKQEQENAEETIVKNKDAELIQSRVKDKRQIYQERLDQKEEILDKTKSMVDSIGKLLLLPMFKADYESIKEQLSQEGSRISVDVLQESLQKDHCELCHQSLGDKEIFIIKQLIQNYKAQASVEIMQKIVYNYEQEEIKAKEEKEAIHRNLAKLSNIDEKIEEAQEEKDQIEEEFKNFKFNSQELEQVKNALNNARKTIENEQRRDIQYQMELDQWKKEIIFLEKERNSLLSQEKKSIKLIKMLEKIDSYYQVVTKISDDYKILVTQELSEKVTNLYKQLISKKDRDKVSKIEITPDFEIHFYNQYQREVLQDNSQGQKQMLSIAFILALAEYAAKGRDELSFPLLIDTPFGRLDQENRRNLIENIPNLTSQWILLVTDSELSAYETDYFASSNRVGAQYELENDSQGTIIQEKSSVLELRKGAQ